MIDTTNNGGPAFPEIRIRGGDNYNLPMKLYYGGMTLRDYFAAKAVSQIIATCANDTTHGMSEADYFAGRAYEIADAMLKARKNRNDPNATLP